MVIRVCWLPLASVTTRVTVLPGAASVVPVRVGVLSLMLSGADTVMVGAVRSRSSSSSSCASASGAASSGLAESKPAVEMVASPVLSMVMKPPLPLAPATPPTLPAAGAPPAADASNVWVGSVPARIACCRAAMSSGTSPCPCCASWGSSASGVLLGLRVKVVSPPWKLAPSGASNTASLGSTSPSERSVWLPSAATR
ncbi:hypothetical protein D3C78_1170690 [compost metagenome]